MYTCDKSRTDYKVREEVQNLCNVHIRDEKEWRVILEIVFKDIYANYICFGKDIPYTYFIRTAAIVLKLMVSY